MKKLYFLIVLFVLASTSMYAQQADNKLENLQETGFDRCYTVQMTEELEKKNPLFRQSNDTFEEWLKPLIEKHKKTKKQDEILIIPVVIHVVHNGDPVNTVGNITGENISYKQAASQVNVLNQDFRRLAGTPGSEVSGYGLGVDTKIEFRLATIAPDGTATNGVNRVYRADEYWTSNAVDAVLKPSTIWDPTKYLNMWSVKFGGSSGSLLGYAQFPIQSGLPGLPTTGGASTDGVVANYKTFGTKDEDDGSFTLGAPYDTGRTMTHEVGHWLGLRHIWGDGGCSVDDYCDDTPSSDSPNFNCTTEVTKCDTVDMVENYMDYTNDVCMNTFTEDQRVRMITVLENSPRRKELLANEALETSPYNLEAKIFLLAGEVDPNASPCNPPENVVPKFELTSTGPTPITSATISYGVDGGTMMTYEWTGNLEQFDSEIIELPAISEGLVAGDNQLTAQIVSVNGGSDDYEGNNVSSNTYSFGNSSINEYAESDLILKITPDNYGSETTWKIKDANDNVVESGGPYTDDNTDTIEINISLDSNACYSFTIYDEYGDGMCCNFGNGSYELATNSGEVIASGGSYGDSETTAFKIGALGTNDLLDAKAFQLSPNPSHGIIKVAYDFTNPEFYVHVYDLSGKQLVNRKQSNKTVNLEHLKPGIYIVEIVDGKESFTQKIVIK